MQDLDGHMARLMRNGEFEFGTVVAKRIDILRPLIENGFVSISTTLSFRSVSRREVTQQGRGGRQK